MAEQQCPACQGRRVTEQTRHEIVTKPDGTTESRTSTVTAQCGRCSGRGTVTG